MGLHFLHGLFIQDAFFFLLIDKDNITQTRENIDDSIIYVVLTCYTNTAPIFYSLDSLVCGLSSKECASFPACVKQKEISEQRRRIGLVAQHAA
jgi:hypothetical protein